MGTQNLYQENLRKFLVSQAICYAIPMQCVLINLLISDLCTHAIVQNYCDLELTG